MLYSRLGSQVEEHTHTYWHGSWQEQTVKAKPGCAGAALWEILLQKADQKRPAKESSGRRVKQAEVNHCSSPAALPCFKGIQYYENSVVMLLTTMV